MALTPLDRPNGRNDNAAGLAPAAFKATIAPAEADIVVTDAHKSFGVTRALDGVSFSARFGEIHAVVGGNGCGKSTLAKVLSGILPIDSGHVSVMGHTPGTPREARTIGVATVFQEVLVADDVSILDNLFVGVDNLFTRALSHREKYAATETMMKDLTALDIDPDAPTGDLPLSMKQWITIGRAILTRPKVLILDESSAALDFDSTERLFQKMRELRDAGAAVLIITHRIAELIRISDRATVMRDGRDVGVLEKGDITEENLLALMTGASGKETGRGAAASPREGDLFLKAHGLRVWENGPRLDFDLHRGEIVGVAGLDGQGQSEFVRILAGVEQAPEGVPEVRNGATAFDPLRDLEDADRLRVAYVSGDRKREGIFPNLSIFENMMLPLYDKNEKVGGIGVIDWASLSSQFEVMREKLSIKLGFSSDKIISLSGGNQQKVLIGRTLALRPRILVLNDPARGIDVEAKRELYDLLRDFAHQGNAVVFMSSELEEFIGLCNRVLVFRHGGLFHEFGKAEIDPDPILEAMFGRAGNRRAPGARGSGSPLADPDRPVTPRRPSDRRLRLPTPDEVKIKDFGGGRREAQRAEVAAAEAPRGSGIKIRYFD